MTRPLDRMGQEIREGSIVVNAKTGVVFVVVSSRPREAPSYYVDFCAYFLDTSVCTPRSLEAHSSLCTEKSNCFLEVIRETR